MSFRIKEANNAYDSNKVFEYTLDGKVEENGINLLTTGAGSPLNMTLDCPRKGGRCVVKLDTDGGQDAIVTLIGCVLESGDTILTFEDAADEVSLYYKDDRTWILVNNNGSVIVS